MEIFNIHLFEFLLIAGLALVIFGPERLPEMGRFLGKQVARFLAWQQQSPELQLLNDVRAELDSEIASLRDELLRTRKQLDVSQDMETLRNDLRAMVRLRDEPVAVASQMPEAAAQTIAPPGASDAAPGVEPPALAAPDALVEPPALAAPDALVEPPALAASEALVELPALPDVPIAAAAPAAASALTESAAPTGPPGTVPMARPQPRAAAQTTAVRNRLDEATLEPEVPAQSPNGVHHPDVAPPSELPALSVAERDQLLLQIQQLSSELQALVAELHERGLLDPDWRRPELERQQESMLR
jgi:sec-independent protein translocase protein TatB